MSPLRMLQNGHPVHARDTDTPLQICEADLHPVEPVVFEFEVLSPPAEPAPGGVFELAEDGVLVWALPGQEGGAA